MHACLSLLQKYTGDFSGGENPLNDTSAGSDLNDVYSILRLHGSHCSRFLLRTFCTFAEERKRERIFVTNLFKTVTKFWNLIGYEQLETVYVSGL